MRILMPLMFVIFATLGGISIVGFSAGSSSSNSDGEMNGLSFALQLFKEQAVDAAMPEEKVEGLAAYLPLPPVGWTRETYDTAQGEALTGATYQKSAVIISTTNTLLSRFRSANNDRNGAVFTYRKDAETVIVSLTTRTDRDMRSLQGSMMTAIAGNMNSAAVFSDRPGGFGNVHGVNFAFGHTSSRVMATGVEVPINYRTLSASMAGQVSIKVMTNASDASIAEIVGSIDIPGLNKTLTSPDLAVTPGTGLITNQREALSTLPPEPTLSYKAFQKLRDDVSGLSQDDVRLLQQMAKGDIEGWEDIYETYRLNHRLSPALAEILGEKPVLDPLNQVRFEALEMLQNPAILGPHEIELLRGLSNRRFDTRDQALRQVSQTRVYKPNVMRMINKLPAAPVDQVADSTGTVTEAEPAREIVVRRGTAVQQGDALGNECAIELGVRRCTVDEAGQ